MPDQWFPEFGELDNPKGYAMQAPMSANFIKELTMEQHKPIALFQSALLDR